MLTILRLPIMTLNWLPGESVWIRLGTYKKNVGVIQKAHDKMITVRIREIGVRRIHKTSCEAIQQGQYVYPRTVYHRTTVQEDTPRVSPQASPRATNGQVSDDESAISMTNDKSSNEDTVRQCEILITLMDALFIGRDSQSTVSYKEWKHIQARVDLLYSA